MATIQDIRKVMQAYPEVEEAASNTSFRLATFRVGGKGFIAIEKDGVHATFALSAHDVQAQLTQAPFTVESISKAGKLIGVRVTLAEMTLSQLQDLVRLAWDNVGQK